jgi:hypothetical protein
MSNCPRALYFAVVTVLAASGTADATEWFVARGASGQGSDASPFGQIQAAFAVAQPGDTITIRPGQYSESLHTVRGGSAGAPIRLRAEGSRGSVVVTYAAGRVLRIDHPYIVVEGLVLDGQYAAYDTVLVGDAAHYLTLRNVEIRRSSKELIDMGRPQGVLIERSLLHHALNATGGRTDAHAIAAGAVRDLTVRDTDIHTFSGDGLQVDPGRESPGWNNVTVERCRIWLAPLQAPENGFPAGTVPGENAIDTKTGSGFPRAKLTIRDTTAWGYRNGLLTNMAAFNVKENVDVYADGVTVYDSEIAFRLRGPVSSTPGAWVTVANAVVYETQTAFRYENNIEVLKVWNSTIGRNVTRAFQAASSNSNGLDVRNLLVLGTLPAQASDGSNRAVQASAFVDAAQHNYALAPGSPAIDAGVGLAGVTIDRAGTARPQGMAYDVGAYERPTAGPVADDIVVYAARASAMGGEWRVEPDPTAAGGARMWHPDAGASDLPAQAAPIHYFDVTVDVDKDKAYRVWLRAKAESNSRRNDAVWVQFSDSLTASGKPAYRIGTTSATRVTLSECSRCALSEWGWQDNGTGISVLGPLVRFSSSGVKTLRVQSHEDGLSIDQIVLSSTSYLGAAPGALRDDTTILPEF